LLRYPALPEGVPEDLKPILMPGAHFQYKSDLEVRRSESSLEDTEKGDIENQAPNKQELIKE